MNESYIIILVSCFANYLVLSWKSWGNILNNSIAVAFGIFIVAIPIFYFFFLRLNKQKLGNSEFKAKFIEIYEPLKFVEGA